MMYKINISSEDDADHAFETLFASGFVFTTSCRFKSYHEVKRNFPSLQRKDWYWIITGYDKECRMVFGVLRAYESSHQYDEISLDAFLLRKRNEEISMPLSSYYDYKSFISSPW